MGSPFTTAYTRPCPFPVGVPHAAANTAQIPNKIIAYRMEWLLLPKSVEGVRSYATARTDAVQQVFRRLQHLLRPLAGQARRQDLPAHERIGLPLPRHPVYQPPAVERRVGRQGEEENTVPALEFRHPRRPHPRSQPRQVAQRPRGSGEPPEPVQERHLDLVRRIRRSREGE